MEMLLGIVVGYVFVKSRTDIDVYENLNEMI